MVQGSCISPQTGWLNGTCTNSIRRRWIQSRAVPVIFASKQTNNVYLTLIPFNHSPQSAQLPSYAHNQIRFSLPLCLFYSNFFPLHLIWWHSCVYAESLTKLVCVCAYFFVQLFFGSIQSNSEFFSHMFSLISRNNHWQPKRNATICKTTCAVVRTLLQVSVQNIKIETATTTTTSTDTFSAGCFWYLSFVCVHIFREFCYVFLDGDCLFNIKFSTKLR